MSHQCSNETAKALYFTVADLQEFIFNRVDHHNTTGGPVTVLYHTQTKSAIFKCSLSLSLRVVI